jgi:hypothetical protein
MLLIGNQKAVAQDPVRELAIARKESLQTSRQILSSGKPKKTAAKTAVKTQLNLFS